LEPSRPVPSTSTPFSAPLTPESGRAPGAWSWTDPSVLDRLRHIGDPAADDCAAALAKDGATAAMLRPLFGALRKPGSMLPDSAPAPLRAFLANIRTGTRRSDGLPLPVWADRERILRGQRAFRETTLPSVLVMLCKSLPEGYAAPSMAKILNLSGELRARPFHRLMGTLQLLQDVGSPGSFEKDGVATVVAKEMRLLHAGVRTNVARDAMGERAHDAFVAQYGLPINQEDMLGTLLGFSTLVVDGLETLGIPFTKQEAEDYYHVWRVYGHLAGIRRPDLPDEADGMPPTIDDARAFYATYHRHYVGATDFSGDFRTRSIAANPDGVALADAHVGMLTHVMPKFLQSILGTSVARMYMHELTGDVGCARVGVSPVTGHALLKIALEDIPRLWKRLFSRLSPNEHIKASEWFFADLIGLAYSVPITYTVPRTVQDLREFVEAGARTDVPM
jgi:hypothetical protein